MLELTVLIKVLIKISDWQRLWQKHYKGDFGSINFLKEIVFTIREKKKRFGTPNISLVKSSKFLKVDQHAK